MPKMTVHFQSRAPVAFELDDDQLRGSVIERLGSWSNAEAAAAAEGELEDDLMLHVANQGLRALAEAGELLPSEIASINEAADTVERVEIEVPGEGTEEREDCP